MCPTGSRRAFLASLAAASAWPQVIPSEIRKFRDPATEFDLTRLTDPAVSNCWLPRSPLHSVAGRSNSLLYCSDRTGSVQAFRLELRTGESRQLTSATDLDWETVSWSPDEKSLVYFDGPRLIADRKPRSVYEVESGWRHLPSFALSGDAAAAAVVENREGRYRLRVVGIRRDFARTIFEADAPVRLVRFRPKSQNLLYNHGGALSLVNSDGRASQRLNTPEGEAGDAQWSADGRAVQYLFTPAGGRTITLREHFPESGEDRLIGKTTQFVSFARNADSSVFAGISGSVASPYVLLLLRSGSRELTVAEHKASDPSRAVVVFAPGNQRIIYHTDREGRSAIYAIALERFIEKTESSAAQETRSGKPLFT